MGYASIIKFLGTWWKEIGIALVVLAAYLYVTNLQDTVKSQEQDIAVLETNNAALTANNALLETAIGKTNAALDKISSGAGDTKQAFAALNLTVVQQSKALDSKLASILQDKKPITCQDAIQYLVDAKKDYK